MTATTSAARLQGTAWGFLGVLAFSFSLPATKAAIAGGLDAVQTGLGRAVVAGFLAGLTLLFTRAAIPSRRLAARLAIVAAGVVFGFPLFTSIALQSVPAGHGIVVTGLIPAATCLAAMMRTGERISASLLMATGAGLICVIAFGLSQSGGRIAAPDFLLLCAVFAAGIGYAEGGALAREMGGPAVIMWALVMALPVTLAILWLHGGNERIPLASPLAWAGFGYLSLISMFLGFFAWYRGLRLGGIARIGQLQLLQPVLSLLWAGMFLGETIPWPNIAAAFAIMGCVVATQMVR